MAYYIKSGVTSTGITLSRDSMYISSGGVANSTTVDDGSMYIYSGGVANSTTVNSGGWMCISSGGTATDIIWTPCVGNISAYDGAYVTYASKYSGVYFGSDNQLLSHTQSMTGKLVVSGTMYVMNSGVANSTTVNDWGYMYISSGGVANSTTVNDWGYMYISSGGVANSTTMNGCCFMFISSGGVANSTTVNRLCSTYIYNGGTANSTTVNYYGDMYIKSGGVANSTTVNSGGYMCISSGGTATDIIWTPCVGEISADDGAYVTYASKYSGVYFGSNNQLLSHTQSMTGKVVWGAMYVMNSGVADSTTLGSGGYMHIYDGGVANSTTVNDSGRMYIYNGGTANSTTMNYYGRMHIKSGGVANSTTMNDNGFIHISSGGVANSTTMNSSGIMYISSGGVANRTTMNNAGDIYIKSGGVANSSTVNYGDMYISSGGVANSTTVNSDDGFIYIFSGGVANSTTVNSGGWMEIDSGGMHCGSLDITNGATVLAYAGAVIDFTLSDRKANDGYLINNLSLIQGAPTYTITVAADQASGTYKLAQGASNFSGSITIGDKTTSYGSITVSGDDFIHNNTVYSLDLIDGNLTLTIKSNTTPPDSPALSSQYIFINSKYTDKISGKKQDGVTLYYGVNAFASVSEALKKYPDLNDGQLVILDSSVNGNKYANLGKVAATAVVPTIKETADAYSYKAVAAAKGTLNISADSGSTEFIRFATVNLANAEVNAISGGKLSSSEDIKTKVDNKGTVTDTYKFTYTENATGKLTAFNSEIDAVKGYSTVSLTGSEFDELSGGNVKTTSNSKLVDGVTKDQKTISEVNDSVAAGKLTLQADSEVDSINGFSNVTIIDSEAGDIINFTSKDSKSETATYDDAKNTVTRKVTITHTETTAGTLKATNSELGDVTGFATVTLQNVTSAGDFRRVDNEGEKYSTVKETLTVKTTKDGLVIGTYNKTETFTRAGKFTATGSVVGDIENFSSVTLDGSRAGAISNFETSKIVTKGTALWRNMADYGQMEDYDLNLDDMDLTVTETKSLNGSVTLKNHAYADSISNFQSVTMTGSEVDAISNVTKVTVNKGDSSIGSYTGTAGNDTLTIAKGAVLTANKIDLGKDGKDTLAVNGTLVLTGTEVNAFKITGKGEIAADSTLFADLNVAFANTLDVGKTSENFRGTAYEKADDTLKKALKWDGATEYEGWLGDWSGYTTGSDDVDYIKFKASAGDELIVDGISDDNWTLLDNKGNEIRSKNIFADGEFKLAGEYILKLENDSDQSIVYSVTLA